MRQGSVELTSLSGWMEAWHHRDALGYQFEVVPLRDGFDFVGPVVQMELSSSGRHLRVRVPSSVNGSVFDERGELVHTDKRSRLICWAVKNLLADPPRRPQ